MHNGDHKARKHLSQGALQSMLLGTAVLDVEKRLQVTVVVIGDRKGTACGRFPHRLGGFLYRRHRCSPWNHASAFSSFRATAYTFTRSHKHLDKEIDREKRDPRSAPAEDRYAE